MSSTNKTSHNGRQPDMALTENQSDPIFKANSIMTDQDYNLVATRRNSKPRVFDTIAAICKVLQDFGAILSIGWQGCGEKLVCRYVVANRTPKLIVDIFQHESDRLTISLSNGDRWQVNHDELMPDYAHDLAYEIRSATRKIKSVKFKQLALQPEGSNHD